MNIELPNNGLDGFNHKAREELSRSCVEFAEDVIRESNRLESARNSAGNDPEITSSIVHDAVVFVRRGLARPKKNRWVILSRIVSPASFALAGLLYDPVQIQNALHLLAFVVVLAVAFVSTTIHVVAE